MKIQICSDLHLEFSRNREWLKKRPLKASGDILIIAGDTYHLDKDFADLEFIKKVSDEFQKVFLIPGNHEYYNGFDVSTALTNTHIKIKENVFMLNNVSMEIEGINFVFSTMWSKIQKNILQVMRGMADFKMIRFNDNQFTINDYNEIHDKSFEFISRAVKSVEKTVVVTHHLPSVECNAEEFKESILNEAFCVDKTNFIKNSDIDFWIYGHSHRNLNDFNIGKTRMVTNQFGYADWNEHHSFDYQKIIQIT